MMMKNVFFPTPNSLRFLVNYPFHNSYYMAGAGVWQGFFREYTRDGGTEGRMNRGTEGRTINAEGRTDRCTEGRKDGTKHNQNQIRGQRAAVILFSHCPFPHFFGHFFYGISERCPWHCFFMFHHIFKYFFGVSFGRGFKHPPIPFLHHIIRVVS